MKLFYCCLLLLGVGALAKERTKRQATYSFPGPRTERAYRPNVYVEEQEDRDSYQPPRRQFQAQHVQPQYAPTSPQSRSPVAPQPPPSAPAPPAPVAQPPSYEAPRAAAPASRPQSRPASRRASSTSNRANKYGSAPQQSLNGHDEEEEDVPDPLSLLLQDSQFSCGGKTDGYYADDSVNCQVFHYCVGGAKHSWMCPENTVFHQVHLNCVPDAQDICSQSQKFHFVNDYLYKPVDYDGPNNTARYSQRYYPDGYVVGDPLVAPQEQQARRPQQTYPAPAPAAPRPPPRQIAPAPPAPQQQPSYRAPPSQSAAAYRSAPASRPASRPSRPVESYPRDEAPPGYRVVSQPPSAPSGQSYRPSQSQQAPRQPPPQGYRVVQPEAPPASHSSSYSSEESPYPVQPQPQSRRPSQSGPQAQARPTAGYTPPREQQYRPSARSAAGYPAYSSNNAAGVQYDEDY